MRCFHVIFLEGTTSVTVHKCRNERLFLSLLFYNNDGDGDGDGNGGDDDDDNNNFILGEETVFVLPFVKPTIELQIFDVPVWVEDNVIIQALSCFGRVVGDIRRGFVKASNGFRIGTGVRFCSFIKTVPIPSYVHV